MKIPEITIQNTFKIPTLGIGTWEMGGRQSADTSEDEKFIRAIRFALENGIRHIDTAENYASGHTEEVVGNAIKGYERKKLLITSKVSKENLRYKNLLRSAENSLKRLQTDYLDLYLLHHPNPDVPLSETMKAINELIEKGLIRNFGLSNFPAELVAQVMQLTDTPIITNQVEYNLFSRNNGQETKDVESTIIPFCIENNISITAWRPVLKGAKSPLRQPHITQIAEQHNATPMQIALAWLLNKPLMLAIPKMTSEKHILENIAAASIRFSEEEMRVLDTLSQ